MRKWAFHLSFCRNFCSLFFFFVDTCFHPTAAFCCWLSALRESLVWSQHLTRSKTTHGQIQMQGGILCRLLIGPDTKYIFDRIPSQIWMTIHEVEWLHKSPPQQLWHTQNRNILPIHADYSRWWKHIYRALGPEMKDSHHAISPQTTHIYKSVTIIRHPGVKIGTFILAMLSLSHAHTLHKPCNQDSLYISTYFSESLLALACSRQWQATNPWHHRWW